MTTPISSTFGPPLNQPLSGGNYPAQLPTEPQAPPANPADAVSISDEAKKLLTARTVGAVVDNPIAAAAVSDNPQVDEVATNIYAAQQAQKALDVYTDVLSSPDEGGGSERSPLAIAAVSDNPQTDELATTIYSAQTIQAMLDTYTEVSQSANEQYSSSSSVDEKA